MGSKLAVCFVSSGLVLAAPAPADQPPPSPFQYFAGRWACSGEFSSNHKPISSALSFFFDGRTGALLKHHDDNPPNAYHAMELWAAGKENTYDAMIAVPSGVRYFHATGWSGDTWVWTNASDAKPVDRFAYTRLDEATMRVDWSVSKDGVRFVVGDTLTCKRA
jgi:hypothetical protein